MSRLKLAETLDAYRVFPRLVLFFYIIAIGIITDWYLDFEVKYTTECDHKVLELVLEKEELNKAREAACSITGVVGRPGGYTALVSAFIGAGAAVFGFYVNSGRKWSNE